MPSGPRPPLPPPLARVAISGTQTTLPWTNVFYLDLSGASIVSADLNTLAGDIASEWNSSIAANVSVDTDLTEVAIVYVPSVGNELTGIWTGTHVGTASGSTIDNAATCAVVNFHINAYYRGGHPRLYMAGLTTGQVSGTNVLTPTVQGNIATSWSAFLTAVNAMTTTNITAVQMGTCSFQTGNAWRVPPIFRPYKSVTVRSLIGTQRRRIRV